MQYIAPSSDIEVVMQGVWQQVMGLEKPPSMESDFFAIGGTSLIGLKLTAATRKAFGFNSSLPGNMEAWCSGAASAGSCM